MIDHASIGVRDLDGAVAFYEPVLATIGLARLVVRAATVGFGKRYPEFWLNARPGMARPGDSGGHLCLRARTRDRSTLSTGPRSRWARSTMVRPDRDPNTATATTPPSSAILTAIGSRS